MPSGIFKRTLKTRKKMSESAEKRFENKENHPCYGKHLSDETKEKIRIAHLGKHRTQEVIERLKFTYSRENNGMYGKHHTKETLEKMSKTFFKKGNTSYNKGIPCPKETKGKISKALKGHPMSEEVRRKISNNLKGENNPNWQGGISFEPYSPEFNRQLKELIRQRDGYKCQLCGMPECENIEKLSIHHIDYVKKNCLPNNLITLCKSCNAKVNNNREGWIKYFHKKVRRIKIGSGYLSRNINQFNHKDR